MQAPGAGMSLLRAKCPTCKANTAVATPNGWFKDHFAHPCNLHLHLQAADSDRTVAEHITGNQDGRGARQCQRLVVECEQVGDADDGAGQRIVQHADHLHRPAAEEAGASDEIADADAVEPAERHADQCNDQRVPDRWQAFAENQPVMLQRQRIDTIAVVALAHMQLAHQPDEHRQAAYLVVALGEGIELGTGVEVGLLHAHRHV